MERTKVKTIGNEVREAVAEVLKKHNMIVTKNNIRYGENDITFTIGSILDMVALNYLEHTQQNKDNLRRGFAPSGTVCLVRDKGEEYEAVIIKPRRSKYLMAWLNDDDTVGDRFIINFTGPKLA